MSRISLEHDSNENRTLIPAVQKECQAFIMEEVLPILSKQIDIASKLCAMNDIDGACNELCDMLDGITDACNIIQSMSDAISLDAYQKAPEILHVHEESEDEYMDEEEYEDEDEEEESDGRDNINPNACRMYCSSCNNTRCRFYDKTH